MNSLAGLFCAFHLEVSSNNSALRLEPHDSLSIYSYSTVSSLFKISCHGGFQHAVYFAVQIMWQRYINTGDRRDDLRSVVVWKWKIFNQRQGGDDIFGLFHSSRQYRTSSYHQQQFTIKDASWFSELWQKSWNLGKCGLNWPSVHKIVWQ